MARKIVKNQTGWTPYDFGSGAGFRAVKYDSPTCRVSKSTLSFYQCDGLEHDQEIRVLVSGNGRFGIVPHAGSGKKLKGNKSKTRVGFSSKRLVKDLGLVDDTDKVIKSELPGKREKINKLDVWVFG